MPRSRRRARSRGGTLSRRGALGLIAGGVGIAGIHSSGAFSVRGAARSLGVGVASDESALLGIDIEDAVGEPGDRIAVVTLENRFSERLDEITVTVTSGNTIGVEAIDEPDEIAPGGRETITGELVGPSGQAAEEELDVEIAVSGPNESVETSRSITITLERSTCVEVIEGAEIEYPGSYGLPSECAVELVADDQATLDLSGNDALPEYLDIDAGGSVNGGLVGTSSIDGNVDIDAGGSVAIRLVGNSSISGDVTIEAEGSVAVSLTGNSRIGGNVEIDAGGSAHVTGESNVDGVVQT